MISRRTFVKSLVSGLFVPASFAQPLTINDAVKNTPKSGGAASQTALVIPDPTGQNQFPGGTTTQFGFQFITNASMTITDIGRWKISGNTDTVSLTITNSDGSSTLATASLNLTTATTGAMNFVSLGTPLTIAAGTYNCFCSYANDGAAGVFYSGSGNNGVPITSFASPITQVTSSHVGGAGYGTLAGNSVLGPVNFKFHL